MSVNWIDFIQDKSHLAILFHQRDRYTTGDRYRLFKELVEEHFPSKPQMTLSSYTQEYLPTLPETADGVVILRAERRDAEEILSRMYERYKIPVALSLEEGSWRRGLEAGFQGRFGLVRHELKNVVEMRLSESLERDIEYDGATFQVLQLDREMMGTLANKLSVDPTLPPGWVGWRTVDNEMKWADASPSEVRNHLFGLLGTLGARTQTLYAHQWAKKAQIDALPDDEDAFDGFDPLEGWPEY
jgi:hypothetical protein